MNKLPAIPRDAAAALAVAYYMAQGVPPSRVAEILGRDRSTVSRLAKDARENGWLVERPEFRPPPEWRDVFRAYVAVPSLEKRLLDTFGHPLRRCTVIPAIPDKNVPGETDDQARGRENRRGLLMQEVVAITAGQRLGRIIALGPDAVPTRDRSGNQYLSQDVVVGWGAMVNSLLSRATIPSREGAPDPPYGDVRAFPVLGNFPLPHQTDRYVSADPESVSFAEEESIRFSANANADVLARQFCGQKLPPRRMLTVGVFKATREDFLRCGPLLSADRTLVELYGQFWDNPGSQDGAIWRADTFVTSLGAHPGLPESGSAVRGFSPLAAYSDFKDALPMDAIGDVCGVLFDGDGKEVNNPDRQVVGLRLEHIEALSRRHVDLVDAKARDGREPGPRGAGVFMATSGTGKAKSLLALLKRGYVNELIIPSDLAERVLLLASP
ncbi:MAG: hypothetical protein HQL33_07820 [Alphaproteobacteria bacterium]|nr:hypothetical protein [Alphaproteobacteria bacterium]